MPESVTPCNPTFGEEMLGYVEEGLSNGERAINVQSQVIITQNMVTQSDKIK
jgi:hypothetical protein